MKTQTNNNKNIGGKGEILIFSALRKKKWNKIVSAIIALVFLFNTLTPAYAWRPGNRGESSSFEMFAKGALSGAITSLMVYLNPVAGAASSVASDIAGTVVYYNDYENYNKPRFDLKLFVFWGPKIKTFKKGETIAMIAGIVAGAAAGFAQGLAQGAGSAGGETVKQVGTETAKQVGTEAAQNAANAALQAGAQATVTSVVASTVTQSFLNSLLGTLVNIGKFFVKMVVDAAKAAWQMITSPIKTIIKIFQGIGKAFQAIWNKIAGKAAKETVKQGAKETAKQAGQGILKTIGNAVVQAFVAIGKAIGRIAVALFKAVKAVVWDIPVGMVKGFFKTVFSGAFWKSVGKAIYDTVKAVVYDLPVGIAKGVTSKAFWAKLWDATGGALIRTVKTVATLVWNTPVSVFKTLKKVFTQSPIKTLKDFGKFLNELPARSLNFWKSVGNRIYKIIKAKFMNSAPSPYVMYGQQGIKGLGKAVVHMVTDIVVRLYESAAQDAVEEYAEDELGLDEGIAEVLAGEFMRLAGSKFINGVVRTAFATPFGWTVGTNGGLLTDEQVAQRNAVNNLRQQKQQVSNGTASPETIKQLQDQGLLKRDEKTGELVFVVNDANGETATLPVAQASQLSDDQLASVQVVLADGRVMSAEEAKAEKSEVAGIVAGAGENRQVILNEAMMNGIMQGSVTRDENTGELMGEIPVASGETVDLPAAQAEQLSMETINGIMQGSVTRDNVSGELMAEVSDGEGGTASLPVAQAGKLSMGQLADGEVLLEDGKIVTLAQAEAENSDIVAVVIGEGENRQVVFVDTEKMNNTVLGELSMLGQQTKDTAGWDPLTGIQGKNISDRNFLSAGFAAVRTTDLGSFVSVAIKIAALKMLKFTKAHDNRYTELWKKAVAQALGGITGNAVREWDKLGSWYAGNDSSPSAEKKKKAALAAIDKKENDLKSAAELEIKNLDTLAQKTTDQEELLEIANRKQAVENDLRGELDNLEQKREMVNNGGAPSSPDTAASSGAPVQNTTAVASGEDNVPPGPGGVDMNMDHAIIIHQGAGEGGSDVYAVGDREFDNEADAKAYSAQVAQDHRQSGASSLGSESTTSGAGFTVGTTEVSTKTPVAQDGSGTPSGSSGQSSYSGKKELTNVLRGTAPNNNGSQEKPAYKNPYSLRGNMSYSDSMISSINNEVGSAVSRILWAKIAQDNNINPGAAEAIGHLLASEAGASIINTLYNTDPNKGTKYVLVKVGEDENAEGAESTLEEVHGAHEENRDGETVHVDEEGGSYLVYYSDEGDQGVFTQRGSAEGESLTMAQVEEKYGDNYNLVYDKNSKKYMIIAKGEDGSSQTFDSNITGVYRYEQREVDSPAPSYQRVNRNADGSFSEVSGPEGSFTDSQFQDNFKGNGTVIETSVLTGQQIIQIENNNGETVLLMDRRDPYLKAKPTADLKGVGRIIQATAEDTLPQFVMAAGRAAGAFTPPAQNGGFNVLGAEMQKQTNLINRTDSLMKGGSGSMADAMNFAGVIEQTADGILGEAIGSATGNYMLPLKYRNYFVPTTTGDARAARNQRLRSEKIPLAVALQRTLDEQEKQSISELQRKVDRRRQIARRLGELDAERRATRDLDTRTRAGRHIPAGEDMDWEPGEEWSASVDRRLAQISEERAGLVNERKQIDQEIEDIVVVIAPSVLGDAMLGDTPEEISSRLRSNSPAIMDRLMNMVPEEMQPAVAELAQAQDQKEGNSAELEQLENQREALELLIQHVDNGGEVVISEDGLISISGGDDEVSVSLGQIAYLSDVEIMKLEGSFNFQSRVNRESLSLTGRRENVEALIEEIKQGTGITVTRNSDAEITIATEGGRNKVNLPAEDASLDQAISDAPVAFLTEALVVIKQDQDKMSGRQGELSDILNDLYSQTSSRFQAQHDSLTEQNHDLETQISGRINEITLVVLENTEQSDIVFDPQDIVQLVNADVSAQDNLVIQKLSELIGRERFIENEEQRVAFNNQVVALAQQLDPRVLGQIIKNGADFKGDRAEVSQVIVENLPAAIDSINNLINTEDDELVMGGWMRYNVDRRITESAPMSDSTIQRQIGFMKNAPGEGFPIETIEKTEIALKRGQGIMVESSYNPYLSGIPMPTEVYANQRLTDLRGSQNRLRGEVARYTKDGVVFEVATENMKNFMEKRREQEELREQLEDRTISRTPEEIRAIEVALETLGIEIINFIEAEETSADATAADRIIAIEQLRKKDPSLILATHIPSDPPEHKEQVEQTLREIREGRTVYTPEFGLLQRTTRDLFRRPQETSYYEYDYNPASGRWEHIKKDMSAKYYYNTFGLALVENTDYSHVSLPETWRTIKTTHTETQEGGVEASTDSFREWLNNPEKADEISGQIRTGEYGVRRPMEQFISDFQALPEEDRVSRTRELFELTREKREDLGYKDGRGQYVRPDLSDATLSDINILALMQEATFEGDRTWDQLSHQEKKEVIWLSTGWRRVAAQAYDQQGVVQDWESLKTIPAGRQSEADPGYPSPDTTSYDTGVAYAPGTAPDQVDIGQIGELLLPGRPTIVTETIEEKDETYSTGANVNYTANFYEIDNGNSPWGGPASSVRMSDINSGPMLQPRAYYATPPSQFMINRFEQDALLPVMDMIRTGVVDEATLERVDNILKDEFDLSFEDVFGVSVEQFDQERAEELKDNYMVAIGSEENDREELLKRNIAREMIAMDRADPNFANRPVEERMDVYLSEDSPIIDLLDNFDQEDAANMVRMFASKKPEDLKMFAVTDRLGMRWMQDSILTEEARTSVSQRASAMDELYASNLSNVQDLQFFSYEKIPGGKTYALPTWGVKTGENADGSVRFNQPRAYTYDQDTLGAMIGNERVKAEGNKNYGEFLDGIGVYNVQDSGRHFITEGTRDSYLNAPYTYRKTIYDPSGKALEIGEGMGATPVIPFTDRIEGRVKIKPVDLGSTSSIEDDATIPEITTTPVSAVTEPIQPRTPKAQVTPGVPFSVPTYMSIPPSIPLTQNIQEDNFGVAETEFVSDDSLIVENMPEEKRIIDINATLDQFQADFNPSKDNQLQGASLGGGQGNRMTVIETALNSI